MICDSGSMLSAWALDRNPRKTGLRVAELAKCPLEPYEDLLYCLRNKVKLNYTQHYKNIWYFP